MGKRGKKFEAKLSGDNRKRLYDLQKDRMVRLEAEATEELVFVEESTKQIIGHVPFLYIPYYMIFAKEVCKKRRKFTGQTLITELEILDQKWASRGLDENILKLIKHYFVPSYPVIAPFRLDISLLDGPDYLV